jgi:hypothetical protein
MHADIYTSLITASILSDAELMFGVLTMWELK